MIKKKTPQTKGKDLKKKRQFGNLKMFFRKILVLKIGNFHRFKWIIKTLRRKKIRKTLDDIV